MESRFGYDGRKIVRGGAGTNEVKGLEGIPGGEMKDSGGSMLVTGDLQGAQASGLSVLC